VEGHERRDYENEDDGDDSEGDNDDDDGNRGADDDDDDEDDHDDDDDDDDSGSDGMSTDSVMTSNAANVFCEKEDQPTNHTYIYMYMSIYTLVYLV
jgi:hypothetical protein